MTRKFNQVYERLIKEGGLYGNIGGTSMGPNRSETSSNVQQQSSPSKTNIKPSTTNVAPRLDTQTRLDPNVTKKVNDNSQFDFKKPMTQQMDNKNAFQLMSRYANEVKSGQAVHPTYHNAILGLVSANPNAIKIMKDQGVTMRDIQNSYLDDSSQNGADPNMKKEMLNKFKTFGF